MFSTEASTTRAGLEVEIIAINQNQSPPSRIFQQGVAPKPEDTHLHVMVPDHGGLRLCESVSIDHDLAHATIAAVAIAQREAQGRHLDFSVLPWMSQQMLTDSRVKNGGH